MKGCEKMGHFSLLRESSWEITYEKKKKRELSRTDKRDKWGEKYINLTRNGITSKLSLFHDG